MTIKYKGYVIADVLGSDAVQVLRGHLKLGYCMDVQDAKRKIDGMENGTFASVNVSFQLGAL
jgi:hypothetical protein